MRLQWWLRPLRQAQCWWRWSAWQSQTDCAGQSDACGFSSGIDPRFWIPHHRGFSWWWYAESGRREAKQSLALQRKYMNKIWLLLHEKLKYLGWHADGSLHLQVLLLSPTDQVGTDWGNQENKLLEMSGNKHSDCHTFGGPWLRIAYTNRQDASRRIFILIAQVCVSYMLTIGSFYSPFSRDLTLRLVRVMRMRWMATSVSTGALPVSLKAYMNENRLLTHWICHWQNWMTLCRDDVLQEAGHLTEKLTIFIGA